MPRGPKGERRPADVIGAAVKVMHILTGEEPADYGSETGKDKAAQELGRKGGKKRCAYRKFYPPSVKRRIARWSASWGICSN
jgi:hypothetical protein